jgi:hypothetical protein
MILTRKRKSENILKWGTKSRPKRITEKDVLNAEKRIVKYEKGDNVITYSFIFMESTYYLKESKTSIGRLEIKREYEMYKFTKSLDNEVSVLFPECYLFSGTLVTKAVKGVPSNALAPEIQSSENGTY